MTHRTLDPADWAEFRSLAHRMVDDMLAHLESLPEQPAWRAMPTEVRESFHAELPRAGVGEAAAYEAFARRVMPYTNGNLHPRFWGWVQGNGTPLGMMADMLAAGINAHAGGFDQAPVLVELEVIRWLAQAMGFPADASGLMVSGGTMANTIGLAVARHAAAAADGWALREEGLQGGRAPLVFYGSTETHNWARKAAELLGLGTKSYRRVPVDAEYRIDVSTLDQMIRDDRAAGLRPFCVIGTAGTVNTGAVDDLAALADIARRESLWFHVDGAFGALIALSPLLRPLLQGMERADSLGFDLHKWGGLPFECACALVRDPVMHAAAFASTASYIAPTERGVMRGGHLFANRGLELTRGFKALKVWMSFLANGTDAIGAVVEQNVRDAQRLAATIDAHPQLERLAPAPLNVVCFRFVAAGASEAELDAINRELLLRIQERGIAIPSGTELDGRYAIRVANVNHRSRPEDFETLLRAVAEVGREVAGVRHATDD